MRTHKWEILFLFIVSLILILPPIIYQYPYPSISDDPPAYIQVIDKVAHGDLSDADSYRYCYPTNVFGGEFCGYRSASTAVVGVVCRILHSDPFWTYYVFHYLALIAIMLCVWLFCTKVFNKWAGYIGTLFVLFGATPVLRYSLYDQMFNLTNWLVFGLMGSLALIYWLRTRRFYYALVSMMLFMISILFHSSTGLEIYLCVGFFLCCMCVYRFFKRQAYKMIAVYTSIFAVICGLLLYFLSPEAKSLFTSVAMGTSIKAGGIDSHVPIIYFFTQNTSIILLMLGAFGLWYVLKKRIANTGLWMMLSYGFVLTVSILVNHLEPARSAQDLGIILLFIYAGAIGTALYHTRTLPKIINAKKTIIFIILVACVPVLYGWFQFHCAITPVDQQAIDFMNSHNGSYSVSTQINPAIYELFIKGDRYVVSGGDYIIFRNEPETAATDPQNRYTIVQGNESKISDYEYRLSRVATFYSEPVTIVIFKGQ